MVLTLAQAATTTPQSGMLWGSPATVLTIAALMVSVGGLWLNIRQARKTAKSAESAKVSAEVATNQAEAANQAREATAASLGKILGVWGEYVSLAKTRLAVDFRIYPMFHDQKASSSLGLRFFNASPERKIAVKAMGVGYGDTNNHTAALVLSAPPRGTEDWSVETDREHTVHMGAGSVAYAVKAAALSTMNMVWVLFEHSEEPIILKDDEVRKFLDMCRALAQWREANPKRFDKREGQWNYEGFEPFGPNFRLRMDD